MEEWKSIEGFSNYVISNMGKVKSINYNKSINSKELTPHKLLNGYLGITLYDDFKKPHTLLIHRLVALAFIPNPNNYEIVNHIDEDRSNNCMNNLEWCNYKYNLNYGNRNRKLSASLTNNPLTSIPVLQYSLNNEFIKEFPSISEAVRYLNCPNRGSGIKNISRSCNNRTSTAYGYKWKFKTL